MERSPDEKVVEERYELHKAIFDSDLKGLNQILMLNKKDLIDKKVRGNLFISPIIACPQLKACRELNYFYFRSKDKHGNTALHLASMLGKKGSLCDGIFIHLSDDNVFTFF